MRLVRSHGLGNDYLVLTEAHALTPALVAEICHRHTGLGSDGILEPVGTERADYGVTIWNPDGSIAEKSGNGLRIFAHWLVAERDAPERFSVDTGHEVVQCWVTGDIIEIEMGTARFGDAVVPDAASERIEVDGHTGVPVSVGNPHFVVFAEQGLDTLPWREWGARLEVHPRFPNRTNVQFAQLIDGQLHIRIWERGAGETLASGSSSCAATAAAVRMGLLAAGRHEVNMPGGVLEVTVRDDASVLLRGPVERVGVLELDAGWLARRSA